VMFLQVCLLTGMFTKVQATLLKTSVYIKKTKDSQLQFSDLFILCINVVLVSLKSGVWFTLIAAALS